MTSPEQISGAADIKRVQIRILRKRGAGWGIARADRHRFIPQFESDLYNLFLRLRFTRRQAKRDAVFDAGDSWFDRTFEESCWLRETRLVGAHHSCDGVEIRLATVFRAMSVDSSDNLLKRLGTDSVPYIQVQ